MDRIDCNKPRHKGEEVGGCHIEANGPVRLKHPFTQSGMSIGLLGVAPSGACRDVVITQYFASMIRLLLFLPADALPLLLLPPMA